MLLPRSRRLLRNAGNLRYDYAEDYNANVLYLRGVAAITRELNIRRINGVIEMKSVWTTWISSSKLYSKIFRS
jgi:hypothetical protein